MLKPFPVRRFKVSGELPLMHVRISDRKIQNVVDLVESVPLPTAGSAPSTPTEKVSCPSPIPEPPVHHSLQLFVKL